MTFGEGESARFLSVALIVIVVPSLLARSRRLTIANAIIGGLMLLKACSLLSTASDMPYECFTSQGTYEDNTSGLVDFEACFTLAAILSYILLLLDWGIWLLKKALAFVRRGMRAC